MFSLFVLIGNPLIVLAIMGLMGYRKRTGFLAGLTVAAPASSGTFTATNIKTGVITLKDGSGNAVTNPLRASASGLTARTTVEFLSSTVNRDDVNATYDFSKVAFKLQQIQQTGLQ